ncbi:hypothetical protein FQZ97_750880 [compost metagenome]
MNIRVAGWPNWSKAKLSVEPTRYALPSAAVATAVATSAPVPPHVVSVSKTCPCAGLSASASRTKTKLANSTFPTAIPFRRAGEGRPQVCVMAFLLLGAKRTWTALMGHSRTARSVSSATSCTPRQRSTSSTKVSRCQPSSVKQRAKHSRYPG